ncbi:MAG: hypothetical protein ACLTQL_02090 [Eisenbergiella sp.]
MFDTRIYDNKIIGGDGKNFLFNCKRAFSANAEKDFRAFMGMSHAVPVPFKFKWGNIEKL